MSLDWKVFLQQKWAVVKCAPIHPHKSAKWTFFTLTSFDSHIIHHMFTFRLCMRETSVWETLLEEWKSNTTVMWDWSVVWHLSLVHIRSPQDPLLSASVSSTHEWFININTKHKPQCALQIFPSIKATSKVTRQMLIGGKGQKTWGWSGHGRE